MNSRKITFNQADFLDCIVLYLASKDITFSIFRTPRLLNSRYQPEEV